MRLGQKFNFSSMSIYMLGYRHSITIDSTDNIVTLFEKIKQSCFDNIWHPANFVVKLVQTFYDVITYTNFTFCVEQTNLLSQN